MAKKALLDVLEQTIGKYVKNLDAESLNVAVWSGKIELHDLLLDCDSVNAELSRQAAEAPNLAVPFRVTAGQFNSFQVHVPWSKLMSSPVILRAKGLQIEVEPYNRTANADFLFAVAESEAARTRKIQQARVQNIHAADDYRKRSNALRKLAEQDLEADSTGKQSASANPNASFGARLVRRILENIQVEISDVHVSLKGSDCKAGVLLDKLQLMTTDKNGKQIFVDRTAAKGGLENSFLYKALQIQGLGVYLDESETRHVRLGSIQEEPTTVLPHSYVLAPLSFEAKLRQADSNLCIEYPKYLLASELSSLSILLSKTQLDLGNKITEAIKPSDKVARPLFPEYRPLGRVSTGTAKDWWKYALRCVGRLNGRRSWAEFFAAFQERKMYIPLYKRHAHHASCSWLKRLNPEELAVLEGVERNRTISVEGLMTWRNIADAQVEKEQEKYDAKRAAEKGSLFTSLFGSSQKKTGAATEEEAPISLSVQEMKELEALTHEQVVDAELSNDSRLCDVKFVLGSLRVNLTSYDLRPVADLQMGTVSTAFDANADGSFGFDLSLASLEITDMVTPKSYFPTVLKNQELPESSDAFSVRIAKAKSGDQQLDVKLSTFEAVASPLLLLELQRLFTLLPQPLSQKSSAQNPMLAQSMSGSVDLFYDANELASSQMTIVTTPMNEPAPLSAPGGSDISGTLIDAWKTKTETQTSWTIDLDIQAPIIVVPENCIEPRANVLVFDLGHLKLLYGKIETAPKVKEWFRINPRHLSDKEDPVLDNALLNITSLTFSIGRVNYGRRLVQKHETSNPTIEGSEDALINPISLSINLGVESRVKEDVPRVCTFGVLPSISLSISPSQLSRVLLISKAWMKVLKDISPPSPEAPHAEDSRADDDMSTSSAPDKIAQFVEQARRLAILPSDQQQQHAFARFHVDMRLQRISLKIWTGDTENGMEAHLISVFASVSSLSDGSTSSQLSMGWFWILDRFDTPSPRRQRLLAHSRLPLSPVALAEDEKYDILGELQRVGAFDENFAGSTDLADIKFRQSAGSSFGAVDPFTSDTLLGDEFNVESILDAKFTSLYVNLNPHGLKTITEMAGKFGEFLGNTMQAEAGSLIVTSPTGMQPRRRSSIGKASKGEEVNAVTSSMSVTLIRATLDNFEVSLNSARDDLPLFVLAMSRTELSLVSSSDQNMKLSLDLGDLSVSTPAIGRTDPQYRTILGLAPGRSKSLLSVLYCVGSRAMETLDLDGLDLKEYEACAEVELSPMRMVYIQAQVLALVEYATEGILGVLATQAASSAAAAAVEIATSIGAKKFFCVKATGFEVVLPQAAYRSKHISVSTGAMQVGYVAMPEPGGGEANITLSDVALADDTGSQMQEEPTMMSIKVILPPDTVGTDEDKAMRVTIDISKASFLLTKWQYAQVLATLDMNIGEADLCLREKLEGSLHNQAPGESDTPSALTGQTHAGVAFVDNPRRLYLDVRIIALSVELCGDTDSEPIVRVGAVDTSIWYKNLPDQKKMTFQVSMLDLICDDRRLKSSGRQYRSLIYQKDPMASGTVEEDAQNLFFVSYEASENGSSSVDVNIGSPRLVLIPDAMSEVLAFLDTPRESKGEEETTPQATKAEIHDGREVIQVDAHETDNTVEVAFVPENEAVDSAAISSVSISLKTGQCSIILVDLGSDSVLLTKNSTATVSSVAETIVLSGTFNAKVTLGRNPHSGEVVDTNAEMHGDKLEAYTAFGRKLSSPLQILDPVDLSIYFSLKVTNGNGTSTRNVDLRAAALTPLDISLSMRNVALVNAIVSSVSECIDDESTNQASDRERFLSEKETARIQKLASALDREGTDPSVHSRQSSCVTEISAPGTVDQDDAKNPRSIVSVKITMPETKLMLINDLQGLDEALLRINVRNLVVGGQSRDCERFARSAAAPFTAFDFNLHTSILADYFDISSNDWEVLLLEPWELSLKAGRIANKRVSSPRPSTTIDMESFPCHLSFSEQFLMSLASANRMWSVYSSATSTAVNSVAQALDGAGLSGTMRRSMAATAARTFISSLPYAVDNSSGVSIRFQVHGEHEDSRTCENGSIEYFRFEPPPAKGSGGKRLYGRDVTFLKSLSVFVGESVIELKDLDRALGSPFRAHELGNGQVLMSRVAKEGKTIVSLHKSLAIVVNLLSSSSPFFTLISMPRFYTYLVV
jgi:vacuolar protein sorting-associated protein 13A/C